MKIKKLLALISLGISSTLFANMLAQHSYVYKDPRIMGMGGANTAVGGYSTSLFYNPAGLTKIKKAHGIEIEVLGLGVSASDNYRTFSEDVQNALDLENDTEQLEAITKVISDNSGINYHADISNYSSISRNGDLFAWSVGFLTAVDNNYMTHDNFATPPGGILAIEARAYSGLVAGIAKSFRVPGGQLDIGLGAKYFYNASLQKNLTVSELVDLPEDFVDENLNESSAGAFDLGLNYRVFRRSMFPTTLSVSLLNIGGLNFDKKEALILDGNVTNNSAPYGDNPMTLNFGIAVAPEVNWAEHLILSADYVDALNANTYTLENITGSTEYTEDDFMKRLRLGASYGAIDNSWFLLTLNGGLYQSSYTAGLDMQLTIVKLSLATYAEEVGLSGGTTSTQDRRYMLNLGIGW